MTSIIGRRNEFKIPVFLHCTKLFRSQPLSLFSCLLKAWTILIPDMFSKEAVNLADNGLHLLKLRLMMFLRKMIMATRGTPVNATSAREKSISSIVPTIPMSMKTSLKRFKTRRNKTVYISTSFVARGSGVGPYLSSTLIGMKRILLNVSLRSLLRMLCDMPVMSLVWSGYSEPTAATRSIPPSNR